MSRPQTSPSDQSFTPTNLCRACQQPTPQCVCEAHCDCPVCHGRGFTCWDDICRGKGYCIHDGPESWCSRCESQGTVLPERVLVVPDETARDIRAFCREHPELAKDEYRYEDDPLLGLCYPAAEAYYHARGCDLEVYCLNWQHVDDDLAGTHWYLREPNGGRWIDLALPLLPPVDLPPFEKGTHRGFITGDDPSNRAATILEALGIEPEKGVADGE